jgi:pyruvate dehydrogenase E2 component (dihydrolipoamide acetyltransferase)
VPHVTQQALADITDLEAARQRLDDPDVKITMTAILTKAVVVVLKSLPHFNSSYDADKQELILKRYFHIGVAVDTKQGLLVPVIRDADRKSVRAIAAELAELAEKARNRQLSLEQLQGGTFTISNLGGIGGTAFTPIVNFPEVAILGVGRSYWQLVQQEEKIVNRLMLPLSLSYDHRVVNGADGARFVTLLANLLADPVRLLVEV